MVQRIIRALLVIGVLLGVSDAQTTYYGPTSPIPGLIKVEIQIYNDPELGGLKVEEVIFNKQSITMKPADINGYKGGGSFQVKPGNYELSWRVSGHTKTWPRTVQHKQKISITPRDTWVQISINGENATVI